MKNRSALREQIAALLRNADFPELAALAGRESGVVTVLVQLLYAPDELLHWRAVEGLGRVAGAHPRQVQKVVGRLLWLLNEDSGSFGWGAAAALGEIGRHQLPLVAEIIPMFCGFLEEEFSRTQMLWGIGRLAAAHPEVLGEVIPFIRPCLTQADPQVRALAAWCLGRLGDREDLAALRHLLPDEHAVELYDDGQLRGTTVGELAQEALAALE